MKLFKKVLSAVLSFGMIFNFAFSLSVFADGGKNSWGTKVSRFKPETLEECCLALDEIFSEEEKEKIRQSRVDNVNSYLRNINVRISGYLGPTINHYWLHSSSEKDEMGRAKPSKLAELLLEHGADFEGEGYCTVTGIILENYRHYLLTGKSSTSIEDLAIDHWFNYLHCFDPDVKRELFQERMEAWKRKRDNTEEATVKSSSWWCTIM